MDHPEMACKDVVSEQPIQIKSHELKIVTDKKGDEIILGSGGFGSVYKAIYHPIGIVAVKQMSKTGTLTERNKNILMREARRLKQMTNHDQILRLHGIVMEKDNYGLVLEYMHFGSVSQFLEKFKVETALLLRISKQVIEAMCWLHGHSPPVKHLDIKADNILINNYCNAKVCDFGLSEWRNTTMMMTQTLEKPERSATITHIAPEVLRDINCEPTTAWDVYAFGITLWEIFSGRIPYDGKGIDVVRSCVMNNQRPDLTKLPKQCPKEIEHMMSNCWVEYIENRPTFAELQSNIQELYNKYITQLQEALFSVRKQIIENHKPESELYKCTMHIDCIENNGLPSELLQQGALTDVVRPVGDNIIATPKVLPIDRNPSAADNVRKLIYPLVNPVRNINSNFASQVRNMSPDVASQVRNINLDVASQVKKMDTSVENSYRNLNANVANHVRNMNPNVTSHARNMNPNMASPVKNVMPFVANPLKHFVPNVALNTKSLISNDENTRPSLAMPDLSQNPNMAMLGTGSIANGVGPLHAKEYLLAAQIMDMDLCGSPMTGAVSYISKDRMIPVDGNDEAENYDLQLLMQQIQLNSDTEKLVQKDKRCVGSNSEWTSNVKYLRSSHQGQTMNAQVNPVTSNPQCQTVTLNPQGQTVTVSPQSQTTKVSPQGQTVTASPQDHPNPQGQTTKVRPQGQTTKVSLQDQTFYQKFQTVSPHCQSVSPQCQTVSSQGQTMSHESGNKESYLKLLQEKSKLLQNPLKEEITVGQITDLTNEIHATVNMLPNFAVISSEEYVSPQDLDEIEEQVSNYPITDLASVTAMALPNFDVLSMEEDLTQQECVQNMRMELTLNEKEARSFENSITGEPTKMSLTIDQLSNVNAFVQYSLNGTSPEGNQTHFSIQTSPTSCNEEAMKTSTLPHTSKSGLSNIGQQQMTTVTLPELLQQTVSTIPRHFTLPENSRQMVTQIHKGMELLNDSQLQQTADNEYFKQAYLKALEVQTYLNSLNVANSEQASQHFSTGHPGQSKDGLIQPTNSPMLQQAINMSLLAQQMTWLPFYMTQNTVQPFSVPYGDISSLKPMPLQGPMNIVTPTVVKNPSRAATHPKCSLSKEPFPDSRRQNNPENESFRDTRPSPDADCSNSYSVTNSTPSFTSQKSYRSHKSLAETDVVPAKPDHVEAPITISHKHAGGGYTRMTMNTLQGEHLPNIQIGNNMTMTVYEYSKEDKHLKSKKERTCKMTDLPISESPLTFDQRNVIVKEIGKDWKRLCRELQLTDANIEQLRYEFLNTGGLNEVMYQAILRWTERNVQRATVKVMAEILWNIEREDIVLKLVM